MHNLNSQRGFASLDKHASDKDFALWNFKWAAWDCRSGDLCMAGRGRLLIIRGKNTGCRKIETLKLCVCSQYWHFMEGFASFCWTLGCYPPGAHQITVQHSKKSTQEISSLYRILSTTIYFTLLEFLTHQYQELDINNLFHLWEIWEM